MSKIAIIGAGFSGLALCYHLLNADQEVTVFDGGGIGGGASGMAAGLMHPYMGKWAQLFWKGQEGMEETKALLALATKAQGEPVYRATGILRLALSFEQERQFRQRAKEAEDVEWWDPLRCQDELRCVCDHPGIFIRSGITVHSGPYLEGLWAVCAQRGAKFFKRDVELETLVSYDCVVIAAGGGIRRLKACEALGVTFNKGQILVCDKPPSFDLRIGLIGKGYVALGRDDTLCYLGSTYEHDFISEEPCLKTACELIFSQVRQFLPGDLDFLVRKCVSGVRVRRQGRYHPVVDRLDERTWVITGMGSRGLIYHSYLGRKLASAIVENEVGILPEEVRMSRGKSGVIEGV